VRLTLASRRERQNGGGNVIRLERTLPDSTDTGGEGPRDATGLGNGGSCGRLRGQQARGPLAPAPHIALPGGPGDFTPYEAPEYVEQELSPLGQLVEHLAEVLGMDHVRVIADCGMETGG
jgi:hypothetical protein